MMPQLDLNGSPAPRVALAPSSQFLDGWPSGAQAIFIEIACAALFWLLLKYLFDSLSRTRGA